MKKKSGRSRKSYSPEYKSQAIDLAKDWGVKKAAAKLGYPGIQTLAAWVRREKKMTEDAEFRYWEALKAENKKLKKELDDLRKTNAILDRVVHNSFRVDLHGSESMRKRKMKEATT